MKNIKEEESSRGPPSETTGLNHRQSTSKPHSDNRASVEMRMLMQGSQATEITIMWTRGLQNFSMLHTSKTYV